MPLLFAFLIILLGITPSAWAAVVHLKDGRTVEGTILQKSNDSIKVDVGGIAMTYFSDEIQDIDGKAVVTLPPAVPASEPALVSAQHAPAPAAVDVDKKALILKFIDVFGTRQALTQNFDAMIKRMPPDKALQAQQLRDRMNIDELIAQLIPVYDRNFTTEDLQSFIKFYDSPEGHKLVNTIPIIMKESVGIVAKYIEDKFATGAPPAS